MAHLSGKLSGGLTRVLKIYDSYNVLSVKERELRFTHIFLFSFFSGNVEVEDVLEQ